MKLNGPISHSYLDDGKEEEETRAKEVSSAAVRVVVGYALTSKKKKSFMQPKFIRLARSSFKSLASFLVMRCFSLPCLLRNLGPYVKMLLWWEYSLICALEGKIEIGYLSLPNKGIEFVPIDLKRPLSEQGPFNIILHKGLRLFNIDVIRKNGTKDVYYVIDINYFPGYGKMPEYEHIFTDFLLNLVQSEHKK
ncbi:Inositol-tetrakisphosphate 1-kinase [Sesamum angolense]|uniref:Inositol-tetrakisphosphate 1-kinase n=1 Tax=Sesamum angolense TaxID=2727404 RepID=A0AAE1WY10_9LAMI|nr:Inositol-tetrakisphosphate 1-kinase [Sesamum angolense]